MDFHTINTIQDAQLRESDGSVEIEENWHGKGEGRGSGRAEEAEGEEGKAEPSIVTKVVTAHNQFSDESDFCTCLLSNSTEIIKLHYKRFHIQTAPITSICVCPQTEDLFSTGSWYGEIYLWLLNELKSSVEDKQVQQQQQKQKQQQTRQEQNWKTAEQTQSLLSSSAASSKRKPDSELSFSPCYGSSGFSSSPAYSPSPSDCLIQTPLKKLCFHKSPILKLQFQRSLPFILFSVGFDRCIAFWDILNGKRDESSNNSEFKTFTSYNSDLIKSGEFLEPVGIHGSHKLISVNRNFHNKKKDYNRNNQNHSINEGGDDFELESDDSYKSFELSAGDDDLCKGGIINDANWISLSYENDDMMTTQTSLYNQRNRFGLNKGGALISGSILTGVSVDDNNLLQVRVESR